MLNKILAMPFDSLIFFVFLGLSLLLMIVSGFIKASTIQGELGWFTLKPGKKAFVIFFGFMIGAICVQYAISQSNKGQEIGAYFVNLMITGIVIYFYYFLYFREISFDSEGIWIKKTFSKFSTLIQWDEIENPEITGNGLKLILKNGNSISFSEYLDGLGQLMNCFWISYFCLENYYDEIDFITIENIGNFESLIGKKILIDITYISENLEEGKSTQMYGRIQSISNQSFVVNLEGSHLGKQFKLPAYLATFEQVEIGKDVILADTGEKIGGIDFISEWCSMEKQWA